MSQVEAIFRGGVFQPLAPVDLRENQRVRLNVEPTSELSTEKWLDRVSMAQEAIRQRISTLPDSAGDIAEDRAR